MGGAKGSPWQNTLWALPRVTLGKTPCWTGIGHELLTIFLRSAWNLVSTLDPGSLVNIAPPFDSPPQATQVACLGSQRDIQTKTTACAVVFVYILRCEEILTRARTYFEQREQWSRASHAPSASLFYTSTYAFGCVVMRLGARSIPRAQQP